MGKTARKSKHSAKMARKRAVKSARRALYASLAGTSKKNKKLGNRRAGPTVYKHAHIMADCGNVGCTRCYPRRVGTKIRVAEGSNHE